MTTRPEKWLEDHKHYPHKDWCLIWPFSREKRVGRGMINVAPGKPKLFSNWAHRVMCQMVHGDPPAPNYDAAHSCGCGHLGCVNPHHLSWKTRSENMLESYREHGRKGANRRGPVYRFTEEQIAEMKAQYEAGVTQVKLGEMYGISQGTVAYYLKVREQRGHHQRKINFWSAEDLAWAKDAIARGLSKHEIAAHLGRPWTSLTKKLAYDASRVTNGEQP